MMELKTKNDYLQLAHKIVDPLIDDYDESGSFVSLPNAISVRKLTKCDVDFEAFARPLWAIAYLVKEGDQSLGKRILRMIVNGTDPKSQSYWGDLFDRCHMLVDMPAICLFLYENVDLVREYYSDQELKQVIDWILQANNVEAWENNWLFFALLNNAFLLNANLGGDRKIIEERWGILNSHYKGEGWYIDGPYGRVDYYIAFGYHFYSLLWLTIDQEMPMDVRNTIIERAERFADDFIVFFDDDGEAVPYGRSMLYRFAQVAFWSAYEKAGLKGKSPGVVKGIINRNLRWWLSKDIFNEDGVLNLGYAYENIKMTEQYSGSGSPYWACKIFVLLALSNDADYWKVEEESLESNLYAQNKALLFLKNEGIVNLYPLNQKVNYNLINSIAKYEKIVYSTRTGFGISKEEGNALKEIGIDGTFAISYDNQNWTIRNRAKSYFIKEDTIHSKWEVDSQTRVNTYVLIHQGWHIRVHIIEGQESLWLADGSYAIPGEVKDCQKDNQKMIIQAKDYCTEVLSFTDGTIERCEMESGLNSLNLKSEVPYILSEVKPGETIIINAFYIGANPSNHDPIINVKNKQWCKILAQRLFKDTLDIIKGKTQLPLVLNVQYQDGTTQKVIVRKNKT